MGRAMASMHKLGRGNLNSFMETLCRGRTVFALEQADDQYHLVRADGWNPDKHTLGSYRPVEPLKSLVFRPRESVGAIAKESGLPEMGERVVVGVKGCDLSALQIHDHVFLKTEPVDPFYEQAREKTIIVSCDCTDARETCFCPTVNEQPYAKEGFDINLSPVADGYVVEAGSERGEQLLKEAGQVLEPADPKIVEERDKARDEMTKKVASQAAEKGLKAGDDLQKAVKDTEEAELWETFAEDCVECGACNLICCTCHCFLLADGMAGDKSLSRVRQWDACLYRNFARVAGGANPRGHRAERLYNRFDKKFVFFPEVLGTYACDGCGRCAEACTGKIDIRDVLKKALDES